MSIVNRDRFRKKLKSLLEVADDESFFQLVWAIDALQSDRVDFAAKYIEYPKEAAGAKLGSKYSIQEWDLETLIGQLLTTPKRKIIEGRRNRVLNCSQFGAGAQAVNYIRQLENAESGMYLKRFKILNELHRIGQRQFSWQRGYFNIPQLYRYSFLYGQGACAGHFEREYGISYNDFSLIGFCLHAAALESPWLKTDYDMTALKVTSEKVRRALDLLSIPLSSAREMATKLVNENGGGLLPVAYKPNILRRFPLIRFGQNEERMRTPIPQLIVLRITSGIYYDLVAGPGNLRNDASDRFEVYCADLIAKTMPKLSVSRSVKYKVEGNEISSPDILIERECGIVVAIECKATKLSFKAQFAEDPIVESRAGYEEVAKGIFQLWRYFSHARRGLLGGSLVEADAHGVVLTLDSWLAMSFDLQKEVLAIAGNLADKDKEITESDRRKVLICAIHDLEQVVTQVNEESFVAVLAAARKDSFDGWLLPNILRDSGLPTSERKPYPFDIGDILPWWNQVEELRTKEGQNGP